MKCKNCNNKIKAVKYCPYCGYENSHSDEWIEKKNKSGLANKKWFKSLIILSMLFVGITFIVILVPDIHLNKLKAKYYFSRGNVDKALEMYDLVVKESKSKDDYFDVSQELAKIGFYNKSNGYINIGLLLEPGDIELLFLLQSNYDALNNHEERILVLYKLNELLPNDLKVLEMIANSQFEIENDEEKLEAYTQVYNYYRDNNEIEKIIPKLFNIVKSIDNPFGKNSHYFFKVLFQELDSQNSISEDNFIDLIISFEELYEYDKANLILNYAFNIYPQSKQLAELRERFDKILVDKSVYFKPIDGLLEVRAEYDLKDINGTIIIDGESYFLSKKYDKDLNQYFFISEKGIIPRNKVVDIEIFLHTDDGTEFSNIERNVLFYTGDLKDLEEIEGYEDVNYLSVYDCANQDYSIYGSLSNINVLKNLETAFLSFSKIEGDLSQLNIESLKNLFLTETLVIGNISALKDTKLLEEIHLGGTLIDGDVSGISNTVGLKKLDISNTNIIGDINDLNVFKNLNSVSLGNTKFYGNLNSISTMNSLKHLNISGTKIEGETKNISNLTRLSNLDLSNTNINGDIKYLSNLQELVYFNIDNTNIEGDLSNLDYALNLRYISIVETGCFGELNSFLHKSLIVKRD